MKQFLLVGVFLIFAFGVAAQQKRVITVDDLWAMKRIGSVVVSPNGEHIAFSVTQYSMEDNSGQTDIYLMSIDGGNIRPILDSEENESSPSFSPDGSKLTYQFDGQIWQCNIDGTEKEQLTNLYTGASGIRWSNDGSKILFVSSVYPDCTTEDCNKERDEAKESSKVEVEVFTELMYRHWDDWRGEKRSHLFIMDLESKETTDLTLNSTFDVPPIALGSKNDYNFSPDGSEVVYTMNKDKMLATSTNNDIFVLSLNGKSKPQQISVSKGNDNQPIYSPNGKFIAFRSMARAGFESDKRTLVLYDRERKELSNISEQLDISIGQMVWAEDSKSIFYTAAKEIYNSIYNINIETKENRLLIKEVAASGLNLAGNKLIFKAQKSTLPFEIFKANFDGSKMEQITSINASLLANLKMNDVETFWSDGPENAKVQSIIVKPPFFDSTKKYPMIFLIHGGPQGHWTDNFHYRWNLQLFASKGYVVVAPNPRGSTGYGQAFTDGISQDWAGKVYEDLMNAYEYALTNYKFIDRNNTFAAGASYGGYMINWIEGHNTKFNALVNHDGVYNLESMYGTTEELWFPEWEMGGTPWENRELYRKWSPSEFVENFKTPMLIVHGGMDFRVPEGQAFELFTALQKMGVDSKFIYFPKESHFVLKPQNAKFWWNSIFNWFEEYKR
ncbi:MAG: S9 family peptidase [Melioribacteraceae bacterium]|nr:S9 family peptidase [Melioribacteraceae bacterium]